MDAPTPAFSSAIGGLLCSICACPGYEKNDDRRAQTYADTYADT